MKKRPPAKKGSAKTAAARAAPKKPVRPVAKPAPAKVAVSVSVPARPVGSTVPPAMSLPAPAEPPVMGFTHVSSRTPMLWAKPAPVEEPSPLARLERLTRFWIAVLLAPICGCGIAGGLYGLVNGFVFMLPNGLAAGTLGSVLIAVAGVVTGSFIGALLGWPLMMSFGLAYHTFLSRRGAATEAALTAGFGLLGALVGVSVAMAPMPAATLAYAPPMPVLALALPWCVLGGGLTGWLFWFIRK